MKRSVFLLLTVLIFAGISAFAAEGDALPEKKEPERFQFEENLRKELHTLLDMISAEYPDLLKNLDQKDTEQALISFLNAIHSGIEPLDGKSSESLSPVRKPSFYPMIQLPGKLIYLRLETIDPQTIKELKRAFQAKAGGIILDLRNCSSGTFAESGKDFRSLLKHDLPHLAILTGPDTEGTAEIIAELLVRNRKGIRIGEATEGKPFPRKVVTSGGKKWLVPQPPEGAEKLRWEKLPPQISEKSLPIQSYESLKQKKAADPADHALSRAADLLTTLNLLDRKGLKK